MSSRLRTQTVISTERSEWRDLIPDILSEDLSTTVLRTSGRDDKKETYIVIPGFDFSVIPGFDRESAGGDAQSGPKLSLGEMFFEDGSDCILGLSSGKCVFEDEKSFIPGTSSGKCIFEDK